ncbi:hypothetical protein TNCV_22081 [Trichonephila clavipes]|nr:hypothetical protein TNCV_22081 [Trichonephila clavipes]
MAGKAVSLHNLLANQNGKIYRQNFEADVFPSVDSTEVFKKSIRLQNKEFKDYIRDIERLNRVPTAASPTSQPKRKTAKRQPASPSKQTPLKKQAKSGESSHPLPPPLAILKALSLLWRKGKLQPKRARMRFQQNQSSR